MTIAKPHRIDRSVTWEPPDTYELERINESLDLIARRIWVLKVCVEHDSHKEFSRIHQVLRSRKKAIKKAYKNGLEDGKHKKKKLV